MFCASHHACEAKLTAVQDTPTVRYGTHEAGRSMKMPAWVRWRTDHPSPLAQHQRQGAAQSAGGRPNHPPGALQRSSPTNRIARAPRSTCPVTGRRRNVQPTSHRRTMHPTRARPDPAPAVIGRPLAMAVGRALLAAPEWPAAGPPPSGGRIRACIAAQAGVALLLLAALLACWPSAAKSTAAPLDQGPAAASTRPRQDPILLSPAVPKPWLPAGWM
jgi:hypothetical protein